MYWSFTSLKLWGAALSLVMVMLLSGCPSVPVEQPQPQPASTPVPAVSPGIDTATYHTVERGESLFAIAQLYGRDYKDIARWNRISPPYALSPGQRLRVDGSGEGVPIGPEYGVPVVTPTPPAPTPIPAVNAEGTHTVQPGEGLYAIATQYGYNFKEVAAWNQIEPPYSLSVGQVLMLSPPEGGVISSPPPVVSPPPAIQPKIAPSAADQDYHIVLPGDTLYKVARHYGYSVAEIALWNGLQTPYSLSLNQKLRISPPDAGSVVPTPSYPSPTPSLPTVKPSTPDAGYHTIAPGDTLYNLSRHYGHSVAEIALWNGLQQPYSLSLGQQLRVSPPEGGEVVIPTPPSPAPNFKPSFDMSPEGGSDSGYHTVAPGDTLYSVSQHYGHSVADLAKWNNLTPPYSLSLGQELRVAPPTSQMMMPGLTPDSRYLRPVGARSSYYIVKPGENLEGIAKKHGLSLTDLADWNGIGSPYSVYPGRKLTVVPH